MWKRAKMREREARVTGQYLFQCTLKVKGKVHPSTSHQAPKGRGRLIALLFLKPRHLMGVGGQRHVPAALPLAKITRTHSTGDWVGLRANLEGAEALARYWDSIPGPFCS